MSTNKFWKTSWIRGGKVLETAWIGKNILAWCIGMNIIFYNILQRIQKIQQCSSREYGDGACCISGHLSMNIYAYAEKVLEPRILVFSYPSMIKISECIKGCDIGYLATAFAGDEFLLSLSTCQDFNLTVWNWRTGEQLTYVKSLITDIDNFSQCLRVSYKKPFCIAQMGLFCGQVYIWQMYENQQNIFLSQNRVQLPEDSLAQGIDWCPDSVKQILAVTDTNGHVFLSNEYGNEVNRIVYSQHCGICPEIEPAAICWYNQGIVLKTTYCQIKFYKKENNNRWQKVWNIQSNFKPCVLTAHAFNNNCLFYYTQEGYLVKLNFVKEQQEPINEIQLYYGPRYKYIDFVYPWGYHLVTVDDYKKISVIDSFNGSEISKINLEMEGVLSHLCSHFDYPLIVATSERGELSVVNLFEPENPKVIICFRIQQTELNLVKITQCGRYIVAVDKLQGNCYCIDLFYKLQIIAKLTTGREIADIVVYTKKQNVILGILFINLKRVFAGDQISFYKLVENSNHFEDAMINLHLNNYYQFLCLLHDKRTLILGTPYLSRFVYIFDVSDIEEIKVVNALCTNHEVRLAKFFADKMWVTSSAFDGYCVIRKLTNLSIKDVLNLHHRRDYGSTKVIINSTGDTVISLGHDGSILAMTLEDKLTEHSNNAKESMNLKIIQNYRYLYKQFTETWVQFETFDQFERNTVWLNWIHQEQIKEEENKFKQEKIAIQHELSLLKTKIKNMIDENENYPEVEKLPISQFDLDRV